MSDLAKLSSRTEEGAVRVVVETPRGSRAKLAYDPELRAFRYSRPLILGLAYPYDWGFVPSTLAPDGDPLDAMVVHDAATAPGVVIDCVLTGVVAITQKKKQKHTSGRERNDRLIVAPAHAPRFTDVRALPKRWRDELEQFFATAVLFEDKGVKVEGWGGPREAARVLAEAERASAKPKR